jgi:hypothetical protein
MPSDPPEWPPRLRFTLRGIILLWAGSFDLPVSRAEAGALCEMLGLDPELEVPVRTPEVPDAD